MSMESQVIETAGRLAMARQVTVLTGAGVSAASGVPTFRGAQGLWKSYRAEALATPEAFGRDPRLVWEWYDWRRQMIARCRPNRGHEVLSEWSRRVPGFTLVTQNVDGLHELAGTERVIRIHGSIWEVRCTAACREPWEDRRVPIRDLPPHCDCGALLRPGVVWFGEAIPEDALGAAARSADCDVFLSVGTSSLVWPAAGLIQDAARHGATTIEINPERTAFSEAVDFAIQGPAEDLLERIDRLLDGSS
jgi:NAD-dependent deacetylase